MATRTVALEGATGLVGRAILDGLLADKSVTAVHVLGRRQLDIADPRLSFHVVDFGALPSFAPLGEVYLALGTTIKAAGGQAAFRVVDFDANLADANSLLYNRAKGELEDVLTQLPFDGLVTPRPCLLETARRSAQAERPPERVLMAVSKPIGAAASCERVQAQLQGDDVDIGRPGRGLMIAQVVSHNTADAARRRIEHGDRIEPRVPRKERDQQQSVNIHRAGRERPGHRGQEDSYQRKFSLGPR